MALVATAQSTVPPLKELADRLERQEGFVDVLSSLRAGHGATLDGAWGSSCALVAAALAQAAPGPLVVVCAHAADVDALADDLALFSTAAVERFPQWDMLPDESSTLDDVAGERIRVLKHLTAPPVHGNRPLIIAASIHGLMQPAPPQQELAASTRTLAVGEEIDPQALADWLTQRGFQATSAVELPGEFSNRGGIVDLFAPDWDDPVRIEFFGDQIESLRRFEVGSQRSLASVPAIDITALPAQTLGRGHFADYLPAQSWVLLIEPGDLEEEGRRYIERVGEPDRLFSYAVTVQQLCRRPSITAEKVARGSLETSFRLKVESVEQFSGEVQRIRQELDSAASGQQVYLICHNEAETHRLTEVFTGSQIAAQGNLHFVIGTLAAGFRLVSERAILLSSGELFHRTEWSRPTKRRLGRAIDSFLDLREGDYVVHVAHGIARYRGLRLLDKAGHSEEHLELEFRDQVKVYVPASKINLVQKYVGGTKVRPTLAKIGGTAWDRQKRQAAEAVTDLASDMLQLQAVRASLPGIAFPADSAWVKEFYQSFPYMETADQLQAIAAVDHDMQQPRPMDRLICGDVGYGKTEVAMRAAFRAVDAGYQVAVLVPTTVLAEQHRRTFAQRMAEYPFSIASLSRFCSPKEQKKILAELAEGTIDIVIGTHRLVSQDVNFHNLGLVIIDEEQRFGVDVKEKLKLLRTVVDVMTLTATPIPRTLHMSLLGLRDISNLETPPAERIPVETRVTRWDDDLVRQALLRELNRGGQVFFVHNRVHDIQQVAARLQRLAPEATIRIGHGQMNEHELEKVMVDFVQHRFDVLLSTTIIESGLDIPNANTMFIDEADEYGLADLHQLRGRVGRYKHRAYCYLLIDPVKTLTPAAAKRLRAIEEFSQMGAGFAIAMRDLEIRGAGNILGTQQSGHIAAVGYEFYCQLLEQAVLRLKKLPPKNVLDVQIDLPGDAFFPRGYIPDMRTKIDLYRRLSRVAEGAEVEELAAELADRFGPRPAEVERMLALVRLRLAARAQGVDSIHLEPGYAVLSYSQRGKIEALAKQSKGRLRIADQRQAYLVLDKNLTNADAVRERIKSLLQP